MKHYILFIVILTALLGGGRWLSSSVGSEQIPERTEDEVTVVPVFSNVLEVTIEANKPVNLSLRQENIGNTYHFLRRYPLFRWNIISWEETREPQEGISHAFRLITHEFRDYFARQKQMGYYIYVLRKIIV